MTLKPALLTLALALGLASPLWAAAPSADISEAALVASLPGFKDQYARVNGVRLHYVEGGKGDLLVLLPGWPETWWSWHKIMPALARKHRVVAVDLRGMGLSDKPADGYEKKVMAADIAALVKQLGYPKATLIGHDIGSMVAFAYAANYPQATDKVVMMDVPHPDAKLATWPLLPQAGTFGDRIDDAHPYAWWFAFHQVKGLPEDLLAGRVQVEQAWFFRYLLKNDAALDARDRAVYAAAYASRDAQRAGNAWYQAFPQDILDDANYSKVDAPILGLGGPGYGWLKDTLERHDPNTQTLKAEGSGHFIAEEKPEQTLSAIEHFLQQGDGS